MSKKQFLWWSRRLAMFARYKSFLSYFVLLTKGNWVCTKAKWWGTLGGADRAEHSQPRYILHHHPFLTIKSLFLVFWRMLVLTLILSNWWKESLMAWRSLVFEIVWWRSSVITCFKLRWRRVAWRSWRPTLSHSRIASLRPNERLWELTKMHGAFSISLFDSFIFNWSGVHFLAEPFLELTKLSQLSRSSVAMYSNKKSYWKPLRAQPLWSQDVR